MTNASTSSTATGLRNSKKSSSSSSSFSGKSKSKSETVNYLLLYEAMVRHQDLEYDATHSHIAMTVGRIRRLGRPSSNRSSSSSRAPWKMGNLVVEEDDDDDDNDNYNDNDDDDGAPKGMLTYLQMRRCLLRLGYTWNRSLPPPAPSSSSSSSASGYCYDDDVSVMSSNSASTLLSAGGQTMTSSNTAMVARDIVATDAQLIMLLTTLVEMEERCRADAIAAANAGGRGARGQRRGGGNAGDELGAGLDRQRADGAAVGFVSSSSSSRLLLLLPFGARGVPLQKLSLPARCRSGRPLPDDQRLHRPRLQPHARREAPLLGLGPLGRGRHRRRHAGGERRHRQRHPSPVRRVEHRKQNADLPLRAARVALPPARQEGGDGLSRLQGPRRVLPGPLELQGLGVRLEAVNDEEHLPGAVAVGWRFFFLGEVWGGRGALRERCCGGFFFFVSFSVRF